ncbi:hypothetical protein O4O00_21920 [Citrobacter sedlakii]|uniref:hypothetical protein n=1 Tax=Citrobacter sedlakii TaxID=67826 RepID=UPI0022B55916|nr:hypothetical protein [Citrobacter sedlakii]MCZ4677014.1 hypothetical protein [Citrobacter sedlakii]MDR5007071.1 hypothetical protein [Citrobacter sedlakii]
MQHIYYLDKQPKPDGYQLVHTARCAECPPEEKRIYLGVFTDCVKAVSEARSVCPRSKGCLLCCWCE